MLLFFYSCRDLKDLQTSANKAIRERTYSQFRTRKVTRAYIRAYDKALKLFGVPYEEADVPTSYGTAHVLIFGPANGEPLVLLHGMNASSTMWYPNVKVFCTRYRVYAIDFLLEPGKSISTRKVMSMEELNRWYNEIFDHFRLQKINLAGESRGGWLAINIALNSPQRIRRLILLSPAQSLIIIKPKKRIFYNLYFAFFPKRSRLRTELKTMSYNVDKLKQDYIDQYYIAVKHEKINMSILQMTTYSDEDLRSLKMPVLLMIGDDDPINDSTSIGRAQKLIPHLHAEMIRNASHFLSFDQADVVNKKIMNFLEK